jgi:transposase
MDRFGNLHPQVKRVVERRQRRARDAGVRTRCDVVLDAASGLSKAEIARRRRVARSTVYSVLERFVRLGLAGLEDRRRENGRCKIDEAYLSRLNAVVRRSPLDFGWPRPTWTRELLVAALERETGVRISVSTMSRALAEIGARRGRPKPTTRCPWPTAKRERRLAKLKRRKAAAPADEVWFDADEADVHLNPKIGLDWMGLGQQKRVATPGTNAKHYVAGALELRTGRLHVVDHHAKTSTLFVLLLWTLARRFPHARRLHLVVDNYQIHKSAMVRAALEALGGKVVLHFLPPYCPDANRIEREWQNLHANVTRNHRAASLDELMSQVRDRVQRRNAAWSQTAVAPPRRMEYTVRQSRTVI